MEDMNVNEIMTGEATEEAMDAAVSGGRNVKTGLALGGAMVLGAVLWERVVKPTARKIANGIAAKKAAKAKKAEPGDLDDVDLDDIPEIK
ncbi:MAG: hypothetical protein SOW46_11025 [Candidatus Aphodomonas sp.]|nr:hypothetical protein [Candidatus Aphodomonas sp.]